MREARRVLEDLTEFEHLDVVRLRPHEKDDPKRTLRWIVAVAAALLAGTILLSTNDPGDPNATEVTASVPIGRHVVRGGVDLALAKVTPRKTTLHMEFISRTPDPNALAEAGVEIGMAGVLAPIEEVARPRATKNGFTVEFPFSVTKGRITRVTIRHLRYRLPGTITAPIDLTPVWPQPKPATTITLGKRVTISGITFTVRDVVAQGRTVSARIEYAPTAAQAFFDVTSMQAPPHAFRPEGQLGGAGGITVMWKDLPPRVRWATLILSDPTLHYQSQRWTWLADDS
jgi:hypothetical protein